MFLEQWLDVIQTVALAITLGVLIKYTLETKKLREATVKQNELGLRPCITINYKYKFLFKNIGHSPALNITIDEVEKEKFIFRFKKINLLEPNDFTLTEFIQVGKRDPKGSKYEWKYDFGRIDNEFTLTIRYENIESKHYYSKVIVYPLAEKIKFLETRRF